MNVLKEICLEKRREVEVLKGKFSIDFFTKKKRKNRNNFLNLLRTKDKDKYNLIAEIKKKSPSAGLIRENFDHIEIALNYKEAGAKCFTGAKGQPRYIKRKKFSHFMAAANKDIAEVLLDIVNTARKSKELQ